MDVNTLIKECFEISSAGWSDWLPADHISRQNWQENVERLLKRSRELYKRPAFGLSESEISVHYHLPIEEFATLIKHRLGLT